MRVSPFEHVLQKMQKMKTLRQTDLRYIYFARKCGVRPVRHLFDQRLLTVEEVVSVLASKESSTVAVQDYSVYGVDHDSEHF